MSDLALPPHMRGRLHNDWLVWPLTKIPRGWSARGPREPKGAADFRYWPPKLHSGKGVCRWESAGANSIIEIPALRNVEIKGSDVYGRTWLVVERNPGHPDFLKSRDLYLPKWIETEVWDEPDPNYHGKYVTKFIRDQYSPSALQKFSNRGWMKLDILAENPEEDDIYHTEWRVLKKREQPIWPETGEDTVLFWRTGTRPDHLDLYYNKSIVGTAGLHWE